MESRTCEKCGKVIEGYTENHVTHLMQQHNLKHEREANQDGKKNTKSN